MTQEREIKVLRNLLHHAIMELAYVHSAEHLSQTDSAHGRRTVEAGMMALGLLDLSDDSIISVWPIEVAEWEQRVTMQREAK